MSIIELPGKAVYVANRHPRLTREAFGERWKQHARAGGAEADPRISAITGFRYCLAVDPTEILPAATNEHDGVALLGLRSVASIPAFAGLLHQSEIAFADELRTFERPVQDVALFTAPEEVLAGDETDVVVLYLARREPVLDASAYGAALLGAATTLVEAGDGATNGLRRWVRDIAVAPAARGFGYDTVHELWFDSLESVASAREWIEHWLETHRPFTEPVSSKLIVASVIRRVGRAPAAPI